MYSFDRTNLNEIYREIKAYIKQYKMPDDRFEVLKQILDTSIIFRQIVATELIESCDCCEKLSTIEQIESNKHCFFKLILQYGISRDSCTTKAFLYDFCGNVIFPDAHYYWLLKSQLLLDPKWLFFEFCSRNRIDFIKILLKKDSYNQFGNLFCLVEKSEVDLAMEDFKETDRNTIKKLIEEYSPIWIVS